MRWLTQGHTASKGWTGIWTQVRSDSRGRTLHRSEGLPHCYCKWALLSGACAGRDLQIQEVCPVMPVEQHGPVVTSGQFPALLLRAHLRNGGVWCRCYPCSWIAGTFPCSTWVGTFQGAPLGLWRSKHKHNLDGPCTRNTRGRVPQGQGEGGPQTTAHPEVSCYWPVARYVQTLEWVLRNSYRNLTLLHHFFIVIYKSISWQQTGKLKKKKTFFTINSLSSSGPDPNCDWR